MNTDPSPPAAPDLPAPVTVQEVCERALQLPCSPDLLPRLLALISAPDTSAEEIAQLIHVDASLAAATLRLANSAAFRGGNCAGTLPEAVLRLGQRELFRLASLASLNRWESGFSSSGGSPGDFCRHALCTALAAELLAEATAALEPEVAYTAGLICNLGKLAIGHACAARLPLLYARCTGGECTWAEAEREVLGFDHLEVTGKLLRAWNFPPPLVQAVEHCETPARAPIETLSLAVHLHAAKYLATSFGPGVPVEGFWFKLDSRLLLDRGFTPAILEQTMAAMHERAHARLHDRLTHGALTL